MKKWMLMLLPALVLAASFWVVPDLCSAQVLVNGYSSEWVEPGPGVDVKVIEPSGDYYKRFTDHANGYSILVPSQMEADVSLSTIRNVFSDGRTRIEVYYDNFSNSNSNATDYIAYGNRYVRGSPRHWTESEYWTDTNGYRTHVMKWSRNALSRVEGDKNHFVCAEIIKNRNEVYTVFIKSSDPIQNAGTIIGSLRIFSKRGQAVDRRDYSPSRTEMNAETKAVYEKFFGPKAKLQWGVFEPSAPQSLGPLHTLEGRMDYKFPVLLHYQMFNEGFPSYGLENAYSEGRLVELTLQTTIAGEVNALWNSSARNLTITYDILDGKYDDYFNDYAQKLKEFGHPVLFRLDNEMNGDWCWYSAYYNGKDTEMYKALWRYVHEVFERNGVDNVIWVWNPHDPSLPQFAWNHYMMYYPGDEYVDVVGLTGYNTGNYFPGERWREFDEIYPTLYSEYSNYFDRPFMITEFASNSVGGDKPGWINRMFDQIGKYDRIKLAVWFSGVDFDRNGQAGRIYLMDEDDVVVKAFHDRLKDYKPKK